MAFCLWAVKMEGLDLEGRVRPVVVVVGFPVGGLEIREASCDVKARLVEEEISFFAFVGFGRGRP